MPKDPGKFYTLTVQFQALLESLSKVPNLKRRKQLLRRMKMLIDEIDGLISSDSQRDDQDPTSNRPRPAEPQLGPERP